MERERDVGSIGLAVLGQSEREKAQITLENEEGCWVIVVTVEGANILAITPAPELEDDLVVVAAVVFRYAAVAVTGDTPIGFSDSSEMKKERSEIAKKKSRGKEK